MMELLAAVVRAASVHLHDVEAQHGQLAVVAVPPIHGLRGEGAVGSGVDVLDDGILPGRIERVGPGDHAPDVELAVTVLGHEGPGVTPARRLQTPRVRRQERGDRTAVRPAPQGEDGRGVHPCRHIDQHAAIRREDRFMIGVTRGQVDEPGAVQLHLADVMVVGILATVHAHADEGRRGCVLVDVQDLFHHPFAGSDGTQRAAVMEVDGVEVTPTGLLRGPEGERIAQVVPETGLERVDEPLRLLLGDEFAPASVFDFVDDDAMAGEASADVLRSQRLPVCRPIEAVGGIRLPGQVRRTAGRGLSIGAEDPGLALRALVSGLVVRNLLGDALGRVDDLVLPDGLLLFAPHGEVPPVGRPRGRPHEGGGPGGTVEDSARRTSVPREQIDVSVLESYVLRTMGRSRSARAGIDRASVPGQLDHGNADPSAIGLLEGAVRREPPELLITPEEKTSVLHRYDGPERQLRG